MDVILHTADGVDENVSLLADSGRVGPEAGFHRLGYGLLPVFGAEHDVHDALDVPKAINAIKVNSSGWMSDLAGSFAWQEGYGAFSVSKSNVAKVVRYIQDQDRHHKKMTFDHEFISMLDKHSIRPEICFRLKHSGAAPNHPSKPTPGLPGTPATALGVFPTFPSPSGLG